MAGALLNEALVNITGKRSSYNSYEHNQDRIIKKQEAMRRVVASLHSYGALSALFPFNFFYHM